MVPCTPYLLWPAWACRHSRKNTSLGANATNRHGTWRFRWRSRHVTGREEHERSTLKVSRFETHRTAHQNLTSPRCVGLRFTHATGLTSTRPRATLTIHGRETQKHQELRDTKGAVVGDNTTTHAGQSNERLIDPDDRYNLLGRSNEHTAIKCLETEMGTRHWRTLTTI